MSDKPLNTPSVLLIEDNQDDIFLAQAAIKDLAFEIQLNTASDAEQAFAMLGIGDHPEYQRLSLMPDLILLDLKLPKTNGIEILSQLRTATETAHIPVVMLTTSNELKDITASYLEGANSYLLKPVDFNAFKNTLTKTLDYWLHTNIRFQDCN